MECQGDECSGESEEFFELIDTERYPYNRITILCKGCAQKLQYRYQYKCELCKGIMSTSGIINPYRGKAFYCFDCLCIKPEREWPITQEDKAELRRTQCLLNKLKLRRELCSFEMATAGINRKKFMPPSWKDKILRKINKRKNFTRSELLSRKREKKEKRLADAKVGLKKFVPGLSDDQINRLVEQIDLKRSPTFQNHTIIDPESFVQWLLESKSKIK
jgi:hypothetical protein